MARLTYDQALGLAGDPSQHLLAVLVSGQNPDGTPYALPTVRNAQTAAAPTSAVVGVASAQVLAANANRTGLVLSNLSSFQMSFGFNGNPAVLGGGITLPPNSAFIMDANTFSTGAVTAIAAGAGSALAIQEYA